MDGEDELDTSEGEEYENEYDDLSDDQGFVDDGDVSDDLSFDLDEDSEEDEEDNAVAIDPNAGIYSNLIRQEPFRCVMASPLCISNLAAARYRCCVVWPSVCLNSASPIACYELPL